MKTRNTLFIVASLMLATVTMAGETIHKQIEIIVDDGTVDGETHLSLNSDDMGFDLHDLQVGETRSIVDESGRSILITREADGFNINVDGKSIDLPAFGGEHGAMWLGDRHGHGHHDNMDMHVMHGARFMSNEDFDGVTIISAKPIDDVTRESIKSLLTSSGHDNEVHFIDGSRAHSGMHKIKIVRKEVESTL